MENTHKKSIQKKSLLIAITLILSLGLAVYANSLDGKFIWDDEFLVEKNEYIKDSSNITKVFTENITVLGQRKWHFYRPLQILSYMVDYSFWKLDVRGYHLTNILLHILVALGIYWLISILFGDRLLSFFTSIFFIAHPIHAGPVSYISARANSMVAFFILLTIIFYIKSLHTKKPTMFFSMILSYIACLLSRELALILPAILLLYHYIFKKKIRPKEFLSILAITFVYILLRLTVLKAFLVHPAISTTLFERLPGFFVAITSYIRLLILPINLHMEYGMKLFSLTDPRVTIGLILLVLPLIYGFRKEKSNNLMLFSVLWFFIVLLPVSNLYPVNAYMSEGWLYVPSIGFFLLLAKGLSSLYRTEKLRILAIVLTIALLSFYSGRTIKENTYWKEPIAFYERILKYAPDSSRAHYNLGKIYYDIGNKEKAISAYKKAIEINPYHAKAYNNLGGAYYHLGKIKEAIPVLEKAIKLNPDYVKAYSNLASAYYSTGKKEESIAMFKKAIEINPGYIDAYYNLGVAYKNIGDNEEAIATYKKLLEINPNYVEAYFDLSVIYFHEKQYGLAIKYCDRIIKLGFKVSPEFLENLRPYRK
ncbi:tetratricopeptide repeat protein [Candidatus Omnitrophota bacterium]